MKNPLRSFLVRSSSVMDIADHIGVDRSNIQYFVKNQEEMGFAADVKDRVEMIAYAYEHLFDVTTRLNAIWDARDGNTKTSPHGFKEIPFEEEYKEHACWLEADIMTGLIYYELKSLTDMLRQWGISIGETSELKYLLKIRDRFLTHPQLLRISRKSARGGAVPVHGGPTTRQVVGLNQWEPATRAFYLGQIGLNPSEPINNPEKRQQNEQLLLSNRRNEDVKDQEIARVKAFGVREPNLELALNELAHILEQEALPKIISIHKEAVEAFKYEPIPWCRRNFWDKK